LCLDVSLLFSKGDPAPGLVHFFSLVPPPFGFLLSTSYTPLGLIWEGWLVVPMNPIRRLTLELLLLVPFTLIFPIGSIVIFFTTPSRLGYETVGEAVKGFKMWSTKEGKRTVVLKCTIFAILFVSILFFSLSGFYFIRQEVALITAFLFLESFALIINYLFIYKRSVGGQSKTIS